MLPSLKCQIFCFRSKFVSFTQLFRQQIQFFKIRLCHFLVYGKMASYKELKFTEKILRKMRQGWTDRQTNGRTNRTDFIRPLSQRRRFDHFFWNFENKIFWNYLAWLWAIWKESILEKGIQSTYFSVQRVQKQWSLAKLGKITFILFECYRFIHKSIDIYLFVLSSKGSWQQRIRIRDSWIMS